MSGAGKPKLVGAVVQAVRLLHAMETSEKPLGVSALAREAKVNPSTAFNILRTLVVEDLVAFDEPAKTYRLGGGLLKLSKGLYGQNLVNTLRPEVARLANETMCLVGLWQVTKERMILIERALADRPMRLDMAVRQRLPLMLGAVGRAMAASLRLSDDRLTAHFERLRWDGAIDARRYIEDVRSAERCGYGVDRGTLYPGVVSIGTVITDRDGQPIYGLTASDLAIHADEDRIHMIGERMAGLSEAYSI